VRASIAKDRTTERIFLPEGATAWLREVRGNASPGDPVFQSIPLVRTLHRDLRAAGVEPVRGTEVLDFHSLRVGCATTMLRRG
ncbi:hypothetical protein, partial [Enterococcus faecium]